MNLSFDEVRQQVIAKRDAAHAVLVAGNEPFGDLAFEFMRKDYALSEALLAYLDRIEIQTDAQRERAKRPRTVERDVMLAREFIRARDGKLGKKSPSSLKENIGHKFGKIKSPRAAARAVDRGLRYLANDRKSKVGRQPG